MEVVSYVRVSALRQGQSGLGLDAQRAAIDAYCKRVGATVAREFREIESGKNSDRKELRRALALDVAAWYTKRVPDFRPLTADGLRLILPMATLAAALKPQS